MEQAEFIVLDFVMQPHPDGFTVAKGRSIDKHHVKWGELHEKVKNKVKSMLVVAAFAEHEKRSVTCEIEGADDDAGHSALASLVIKEPSRHHIMRIEDFLRTYVVPGDNGDIPHDAQPTITIKVRDGNGPYVRFLVTDFALSGPTGGNWKPFTEWYGAIKQLRLLGNAREGMHKRY